MSNRTKTLRIKAEQIIEARKSLIVSLSDGDDYAPLVVDRLTLSEFNDRVLVYVNKKLAS